MGPLRIVSLASCHQLGFRYLIYIYFIEPDRRRGAKSLVIIIVRYVRPYVRPSVRPSSKINKNTTTSKVNNSAIFQHRPVLRVANERYCYIFFIFRVIWGKGVAPKGVLKKTKNDENR